MRFTEFDYTTDLNKLDEDNILSSTSNKVNYNEEQITFINFSHNYCVCFIDVVDSTKITAEINESSKIQEFYSVFLNTMASIIKNHKGRAIKNVGDGLLYYFPRTFNLKNEFAFQNALDCGLSMIAENENLNRYYHHNGLSSIRYRISANYGRVELAVSLNSNNIDLFGSPVNECSKINHLAHPNQMIIHSNLHEILKKTRFYNKYLFTNMSNHQFYGDTNYVIYSVDRREGKKLNRFIEKQFEEQPRANMSFNILIIDDDKDILFTFKAIIRSEGYSNT